MLNARPILRHYVFHAVAGVLNFSTNLVLTIEWFKLLEHPVVFKQWILASTALFFMFKIENVTCVASKD